jgi:hypothetical protein
LLPADPDHPRAVFPLTSLAGNASLRQGQAVESGFACGSGLTRNR